MFALAPGKDGAVGGDGDAVAASSRHSDDAPPSQRLHLLRQQLGLPVAVAQPAITSKAPAPDGAVGGDGEAVAEAVAGSSKNSTKQRCYFKSMTN